ncbi:YhzD family protein [Halalkalibacillus halophilus]|uniref:YhzD family protein n=1 Tax=Halalkalibacillus halophilus TaxID=392827 RepID=UPI0004176396|nr:YhzD family protein [Halalkalibacillus halophilus]
MKTYFLTVYAQDGNALVNETIEAETEESAIKMGKEKLEESDYIDTTHRLVSPDGRLLLFHR